MRKSDIILKAAELIDSHQVEHSCIALIPASPDNYNYSKLKQEYAEFFGIDSHSTAFPEGGKEARKVRVLMLLLFREAMT